MRSSILVTASIALAASCARPTPQTMIPRAGTGERELTTLEQARHVASRLTFGARPGDVERIAQIGVDRWIAAQLSPASMPDVEVDRLLSALETQKKTPFELVADHPAPEEVQQRLAQRRAGAVAPSDFTMEDSLLLRRAQQGTQQMVGQLMAVKLLRAVLAERQLDEVMTDFWENHFSVFIGKSPNRYSIAEYDRVVIRPRALGKFRDLLGAVARSPQMLFYLDNWQSGVDSIHPNVLEQRIESRRQARSDDPVVRAFATLPRRRPRGLNENYARELMELHTLGVDGGYTQQDVINVARALTGWTIDSPQLGGGFVFRPELHDAGEKTVLGHMLAAGRGIEDGEEVLDIVARHPSTARFISFKLARRFVSDEPPTALVDRCAGVFQRTDGDIRETVRCVVSSPEFFSRAAYRSKVKTPFELVASALRAMNAVPDTTPRTAQQVAQLGQPIFGRQTPDGWPDNGDAWMNTGAILNRINFGLRVAGGQVPGAGVGRWPEAARLRPLGREQQVDGVIASILGGDASAATRNMLLAGENPVLQGQQPSMAPNNPPPMFPNGQRPPAPNGQRPAPPPPQLSGLAAIVGLALGSPEFQKR